MTLEVRRIVTSHDASGKAIIKNDEQLLLCTIHTIWRTGCTV